MAILEWLDSRWIRAFLVVIVVHEMYTCVCWWYMYVHTVLCFFHTLLALNCTLSLCMWALGRVKRMLMSLQDSVWQNVTLTDSCVPCDIRSV